MNNEKANFLFPGDRMIILRKFKKEVIEEAIKAYSESQVYYLKFYSAELDVKTLNLLNDLFIDREKLFDNLLKKGESIDIKNYDLIDFNINDL